MTAAITATTTARVTNAATTAAAAITANKQGAKRKAFSSANPQTEKAFLLFGYDLAEPEHKMPGKTCKSGNSMLY